MREERSNESASKLVILWQCFQEAVFLDYKMIWEKR